jgi:hypothetical protein
MKTKFGSIIVDGRGKIGGHVASKNRGGSYIRTKVTPANAQTSFQNSVRNLFTELSQAWRGLTQAQRDAWNAAVSDYSRTDIFGDIRNPSGINLFQRLNNVLNSIGESTILVPPLPSAVENVVATNLSAAVAVPAMSLVFAPTVPADTKVKIFATAPISAGKSYLKNEFRQIDVLDAATVSPKNLLSAYVAKFGGTGTVGQKIAVKIIACNSVTGQVGSASQVEVITVA